MIEDFRRDAIKEWVSGQGDWATSYYQEGIFDPSTGKDTGVTINGTVSAPPMTVTFEHGCGRVLYSSYHTAEHTKGEADHSLLPQGHILGLSAV